MNQIPPIDISPSPQPIKWFKDGTFPLQQQVEWSNEEIDHLALLAQADLLFLIAQMFAPPSAEMQQMLEIEVPEIKKLLNNSSLAEPDNLAEIYQQIRQQAQSLNLETWTAEYNHLFEGNVACPINESGFIRRDKGVILADIAGFYHAFGFKLSEEASEKADHLTGELEFVAMLLVMLAQAPDQEARRTTHDALGSFSFDHLGEWLPTFCERLTETSTLQIYQQMAKLLLSAWTGILTLNQLPLPEGDIQNLPEDDGTPYECGMVE
ncbi:cytoplasmic chaperone TorD family protein [Candidatus Thiomargarita nelsonii]|uniref:Cytoplasmic chaperone TorD family protein n=1 Tax=Candidatus Thiomargarita nelsonii TaxID=1003181 RepID=A0A176RTU2_9GAMM|nr:cytoplasmic chaperone TorD family protein [Candidatus Thiomargarita nelsonii]